MPKCEWTKEKKPSGATNSNKESKKKVEEKNVKKIAGGAYNSLKMWRLNFLLIRLELS